MRPTVIALLIGGLVLAGGIALVVVLTGTNGNASDAGSPAGARMTPSRTTPITPSVPASTSLSPTTTAPAATSTPSPASSAPTKGAPSKGKRRAPTKPITYVVKRGDNLSVIAAWFHLHGYGVLYERNKKVIGDNPNLIFPGQRITISGGGMTVGR